MKLDKDTSQILLAELKIAWHQRMTGDVTNQVYEWRELNNEDEDFLQGIGSNYLHAFVKFLRSYDDDDNFYDPRDKLSDLEDIIVTARRLCECRKLHAWEIKPCWVVYKKLVEFSDKFENQSINTSPEYLEQLENTLAMLSVEVTSIRYELDDIEDFVDLTDKDREWFKEIADRLDEISLDKSGHLYDGLFTLYDKYLPVRQYIECQGNTNKEPCLHELGELCKKVSKAE